MKIKKLIFALTSVALLAMPHFTAYANEKSDSGMAITVVVPTAEDTPQPEPVPLSQVPNLYPIGVSENREHGRREIIRVYELSDHESPDHIPRESFEREGYRYELAEITKGEMLSFDSREHTETITVNTASKDLETVLNLLSQTLEYQSEDGYMGILTLDVSTITIESAGTRTNTSTAKRTREYPHLSSSDLSLVPKTITDGGKTYNLADVDWKSSNTEAIDYTEVPQTYTAVATYTTTVSNTAVIGYNTTAEYKGVISKTSQGKMRYTATFIGIPIVMPVFTATEELKEVETIEESAEISEIPDSQTAGDIVMESGAGQESNIIEETEIEKQNAGIPPAILFILIIFVAVVSYLVGKHGKKFIGKLKKPLCVGIVGIMLFGIPQTAFANGLNGLPDYGFGNSVIENTLYFDTTNVNSQSDFSMQHIHLNQSLSESYSSFTYQNGEWIGRLTVEKSGKVINIYEGESLASMDKGGGRFSFTGANSGNTAIIGHNRGRTNGYFIFVKDLKEGDILSLEMGGTTKKYTVTHQYTVSYTDFSPFAQFGDNRLTLVTCVENQKNMRRIAVAAEI